MKETDLTDPNRWRDDKRHQIVISLDLGLRQDYSAFTISETKPEAFTNVTGARRESMHVWVRDIQRFPLGTGYDEVAQAVHALVYDPRLWLVEGKSGKRVYPTLLVDSGGVGEGVANDLAKNLGLRFIRYVLTGGTSQTHKLGPRRFSVPRTTVFNLLYGAFADNRIHIDPKLKLAKPLLAELANLRPLMSEETGQVRVVHRSGDHDDMAICLASTNWWANRLRQTVRVLGADTPTARLLLGQR